MVMTEPFFYLNFFFAGVINERGVNCSPGKDAMV
jgi:hypothetical protein